MLEIETRFLDRLASSLVTVPTTLLTSPMNPVCNIHHDFSYRKSLLTGLQNKVEQSKERERKQGKTSDRGMLSVSGSLFLWNHIQEEFNRFHRSDPSFPEHYSGRVTKKEEQWK
jgi:hypothetical protein